jgi:hypothetical protein
MNMNAGKLVLCSVLIAAINHSISSKCVPINSDIEPCDMIDYSVHVDQKIDLARAQAKQLIQGHLNEFKNSKKSSKAHKDKLERFSSKFCEQLIRATICNALIPPCEGTGNQRYRKPCMGFDLAIKIGCGIDLSFGDMTFAYPPDCYELPISARATDTQFEDSEMIGSWPQSSGASSTIQSASRSADLVKLGVLLQDNAETEHAAHMLLSALRYSPQDSEAHTR